ncbi:MAG TPA: TULIP family P47-like protein [Symbiobacteriaceae bacterium]|nr:TULIP family P47-like protein [Symbiobacteriaceae bacterium]
MAGTSTGNLTSTLNWDTVFAIPIPQVNAAIIAHKSSPTGFAYVDAKQDSVKGDFGDWQIVQGGDGGLIWLSVPVKNVTGSLEFGDFAWASGELIIEVRLQFIPHTDDAAPASSAGAKPYALKVKASGGTPQDPVVSLKNAIFTAAPTGDAIDTFGTAVVEAVIPALIIDWLNENLADFAHVFAVVNLNEYIDKDAAWAWTKPSYTDYAYTDGATAETSILGVLCMTGGRTGTVQQIQAIDPYAIPSGSIAGYLVSDERLLGDLMLPTLPLKWPNSSRADYEVVVGGDTSTGKYQHVLQLKAGRSIQLPPVEHDGSTYTPYMKELKIAVEDNLVIFESYTETDVGMGVTAYCRTTHWYTIELGTSNNGQTLIYKEAQSPVVDQGTHASETTEIEKWMIIVAGVLATAVLAVVTDGAGLAVGGVIIGLLTGLAADAPDVIAAVNTDTSPNLDLLTFNTTDPIRWANSGVFNLNYAGLNGPLQLGGTPHFG